MKTLLSYVLTFCILVNAEIPKVSEFIIEVEEPEAVREKIIDTVYTYQMIRRTVREKHND